MAPDYVVQFADGVYMGSDGAFTGAAFSGARSEVLIMEQRLRRSLRGSARMRRIAGYRHAATGAVHGRRTS